MTKNQPPGYLALPPDGAGPPVLVLHAWWGLNDFIQQVCERLAEAGFTAFAPDLYQAKKADTIAEAETLSGALFEQLDQPQAATAAAAAFVREQAGQHDTGLAVIGFSLGAFFALDLADTHPDDVDSVVVFYGTRPGDYSRTKAAFMGHFAEKDEFEPRAEVDALQAALQNAGCPVDFYHYPNTSHWFFEADRAEAYNPAAASLAWERTLAFLRK